MQRPLPSQVEGLLVAERVGDDLVVRQLGPLDEEGQISNHHIQIAVAPVPAGKHSFG